MKSDRGGVGRCVRVITPEGPLLHLVAKAALLFLFLNASPGAGVLHFWNFAFSKFQKNGDVFMRFQAKACGRRIKDLRVCRNLTQEELAVKMNVYHKHIQKIESGVSAGSIELLVCLAEFFEVSMDYLLLGRAANTSDIKKELKKVLDILQPLEENL